MRKQWKGWIAGVLSAAMILTAGGVDRFSYDASAADEETALILSDEDLQSLKVTYNDKTNIGEEHEKELSDGTKLTIKDNGSIQTALDSKSLVASELGVGINLGNRLEAVWEIKDEESKKNLSGTDYDMGWNTGVITRELIDCIHSYGINTLRVPVAWSNGDWDDGTYTIQPGLLDRVETVVNYALDQGMYVVINDHWDNQWWGQFGACKKDADGKKVVDEETRASAWVRYERYWTQIAERFQGYSDHLIFEGANEELGDRLNDSIVLNGPAKGYAKPSSAGKETIALGGNLSAAEIWETVNKINQLFVDTVRKTGGNNEQRFLLIPGYNTSMEQTKNEKFVMPTDSKEANGVKKLLLSVHTYSPQHFAFEHAYGHYTTSDREALEQEFANLQRFVDEGYGTIIGECGFCEPKSVTDGVTQWFYDIYKLSQKYFATPVLWDTGSWFDPKEAVLQYKDIAVFWNTVNQAKGDTSITAETGGTVYEPGSATEVTIPEYLERKIWARKGLHAYLFYQTNSWDYRDAYLPQKNLGKDKHSWEYIKANGSEITKDVQVTDVYLTGDGTYTVGFSKIELPGNGFRMLGISTDILSEKYGDQLEVEFEKVEIDGKEVPLATKQAMLKEDDRGSDFLLINIYDKSDGKNVYPLGDANENEEITMPEQSIFVTFKISGLQRIVNELAEGLYIDPETDSPIKVDVNAPWVDPEEQPEPTVQPSAQPSAAPTVNAKNPCKKVTAAKKTVSVKRGKSKTLTFKLTNTTASKKTTDKISVKSSNKKIKAAVVKKKTTAKKVVVKVTVNKKAKKKSKATITLKVGKKSAKTTVKVK